MKNGDTPGREGSTNGWSWTHSDFMAETDLTRMTALLRAGHDLEPAEAAIAARRIADPEVGDGERREFLVALAAKGETAAEVAAIAECFRGLARDPGLDAYAGEAIDIVGTGGDRSGTFNLSTATALLVAACGQVVIKHGNRSITSKSGSADLLAALGVPLEADDATLRERLGRDGFVFLFAPQFHPAFKAVMPVRKAMAAAGQRSVFNLLGPLVNPARPGYELMGVFADGWTGPLAGALDRLGLKGGFVVHSVLSDGRAVDELTTCGENHAVGFGIHRGMDLRFRATDYGLTDGDPDGLNGGSPEENRLTLEAIAEGRGPEAIVESLLLGAGFALWTTGREVSVAEGIGRARDVLMDGGFRRWLDGLRAEPGT